MADGADMIGAVAPGPGGRPRILWLQVATMLLAAFVPVAWLIGRRAVPPPAPLPLLLAPDEPAINLFGSPRGLAAGAAPMRLNPPADRNGAYRLKVLIAGSEEAGHPPYRLVLEGPEGGDLWQGTWGGAEEGSGAGFELVLPAAGLRSGRYALRVEDSAATLRIYPFIVP